MLFSRTHFSQVLWFDGWAILQDQQDMGWKLYCRFQWSIRDDPSLWDKSTSQHCQVIWTFILHRLVGMDLFFSDSTYRRRDDLCITYFHQDPLSRNQRIPWIEKAKGTYGGSLYARILSRHVSQRQSQKHPFRHQLLDKYRSWCFDRRFTWMASNCTSTNHA